MLVNGSRCAIFQKRARVLALWGTRLSQKLQCSEALQCTQYNVRVSNTLNNVRIASDLTASGIRFNSETQVARYNIFNSTRLRLMWIIKKLFD